MSKFLPTAKAPMLAMLPLLMGCAGSSPPPPPLIRTVTVKEVPPRALLDYPPAPEIPASLSSRDDIRNLALEFAAWGKELAARLDALKEWSAKAAQ